MMKMRGKKRKMMLDKKKNINRKSDKKKDKNRKEVNKRQMWSSKSSKCNGTNR